MNRASPAGFGGGAPILIAVYDDTQSAPTVVPVVDLPASEDAVTGFIDALADQVYGLSREQGGRLPYLVFRELIGNLVHASFHEVVITLLDAGNTLRLSDRGPGIRDKEAAVRPGFTTADARAKKWIRGVGSGLSVVRETLSGLGGTLEIDDNLGGGTVITAGISPGNNRLASAPVPAYNLSERQLRALLLAVELAPVGPTRLAHELGVSTSTAYRDLVSLEDAGFVTTLPMTGHRSVTEAGLAYLNTLF